MNIECGIHTGEDLADRICHGHGQGREESFRFRHLSEVGRVPDAAVRPESHKQMEVLVREASRLSAEVYLILHGGATNVSNALHCSLTEHRAVISVDMRAMNRIIHVDKEKMLVRAEAEVTGLKLHEQLKELGVTLGHELDPWEFSTLGGWVATRSSGMKKNVYGNIEELIVNVRAVIQSTMTRATNGPRVSMRPDTTHFLIGSEGILRIFTEVALRIREFLQVQVYDSIVFSGFTEGVEAMHDVMRSKRVPALIRLLDNTQFQLGQALKPSGPENIFASWIDACKKYYVTKIYGFEIARMCVATVLMVRKAQILRGAGPVCDPAVEARLERER